MDRQKLLMVFAVAWVSAGLLVWLLYSTTKAPKVESTISILAAVNDMPAGTRLKRSDLKTVRVPEKDAPKLAITDINVVLDRPLLFPVSANEPLISSKVASAGGAEGLAATIEIGKRAISVPITDTSGVAGLIVPRSHVDVLFTRPGSATDAVTATILEDVTVLSIGRVTEAAAQVTAANASAAVGRPQNTAATLLVTPAQARKLELAKNQGKISLALRNPLDRSTAGDKSSTMSSELYPEAPRAKDLRNAKDWAQLTRADLKIEKKEPPPKPRNVIDVYRGDKHVQEVFP
jgi:pilus assembly protein CpaB